MKIKVIALILATSIISSFVGCSDKNKSVESAQSSVATQAMNQKMVLSIILGSTRQGRTSEKIGLLLKQMADKRTDITAEIIDLRDYNLPFLNDEIAPSDREKITDPIIQKWSDTISKADAFIIVLPEYNAGYPGVLKNAMDSLYKEWNNKPVGFVGYSGGRSGASSAIAQLRTVAHALEMKSVSTDVKIPSAWKAFDDNGNFKDKNIESDFNKVIEQVLFVHSAQVK